MSTEAELKIHIIELIRSYESILESKGITHPFYLQEELNLKELFELRAILKELRDLARTPI